MKTTRIALLAMAVLLLGSVAGAAYAQTSLSAGIHVGPSGQASVDLGFFYDDLASYGNWIQRPSYGWVWTPQSVSTSWQPYQNGHWVWTDQGWTWVTDEPYGWATYHYGRWYEDPEIGWSWVPGSDWSPAWVSWQEGSNYIGWAPLPPSIQINPGFSGGLSVSLAPETYVFVQERYFLAPSITTYIVPRDRIGNIYRETRNVTNYRYSNNRVYNNGVSVDQIQRVVGRPVTRYQIGDLSASQRQNGARVQGNRVEVFRPQVQRAANVQPPSSRPAARRAVVDATQFQQSHPDRAGRRAAAQGASQPATPPAQTRAGQTQPKPAQRTNHNPQVQGARPPSRAQDQPAVTPTGRRNPPSQPAPAQERRQRQPATEQQQPPPQQKQRQPRTQAPPERQRPPQDTPPPQRQPQRQAEPQRQPPPQQQPSQQQKQQQRQQQKDKEKQQEERKPPQR